MGNGEPENPDPPLPLSGFSSLLREDWLPGTTEMTSRLFALLFFWELSESSLLLAESLSAEREEEEGLLDSLGVFLSSPGKKKQPAQACYIGEGNLKYKSHGVCVRCCLRALLKFFWGVGGPGGGFGLAQFSGAPGLSPDV